MTPALLAAGPDPSRRSPLVAAALLPLQAYRRWVSPALPARCRFAPSCSAYAIQALQTRGLLIGTLLSIARLLRCHPFHPGGYDPVPLRGWRPDRPGTRQESRTDA